MYAFLDPSIRFLQETWPLWVFISIGLLIVTLILIAQISMMRHQMEKEIEHKINSIKNTLLTSLTSQEKTLEASLQNKLNEFKADLAEINEKIDGFIYFAQAEQEQTLDTKYEID